MAKKMHEAGVPMDAILMAIEAFEAQIPTIEQSVAARYEAQIAEKRGKDRERTRRYRERNAQSRDDTQQTVSNGVGPETRSSPTPPKETQTLKENPPTGVKRKGSRVTADHRPNIEAAVAEGMPQHVAHQEARKFVDHFLALPGEKGVKLDWDATWRNWFRRAAEYRGIPLHDATGPPSGAGPSVEEIFAAARAKHAAAGTG
jgi:hypothetical protein